ncbi:MAG: hypothetical protein ACM3JG_13050, partial [Thiohalocapsa sp.]
MSDRDALRPIAELVGIGTRHVDALGVWHEPDAETLARLIAAFGLPTAPQQAAEALAATQQAAPFGLMPLEIVAAEDAAPAVQLRLPAGAQAADWHCRLEAGGVHDGRSDGARLALPAGLPLG